MLERILAPNAFRRMPWKNGGGFTTEIFAERDLGMSEMDFAWRASIAEIKQPGPFSRFPGSDRLIMLLDGSPIELCHPGIPRPSVNLERFKPYSFAGDWDTLATIPSSNPSQTSINSFDFNLIIRRDQAYGGLAAFSHDQLQSGSFLNHVHLKSRGSKTRLLFYAFQGGFLLGDLPIAEGEAYLWSGMDLPQLQKISLEEDAKIITAWISFLDHQNPSAHI